MADAAVVVVAEFAAEVAGGVEVVEGAGAEY